MPRTRCSSSRRIGLTIACLFSIVSTVGAAQPAAPQIEIDLPEPAVTIRYPYVLDGTPPLLGSTFSVSFWIDQAVLQVDGFGLELLLDDQLSVRWRDPDPIPVAGVEDGLHRLTLRLVAPNGTPIAEHEIEIFVDQAAYEAIEIPGATDGLTFRPSGQDFGYLPRPTEEDIKQAGGRIPPCRTHNKERYHALWDPDRNCYYDHEHKDDPARVDDIFGSVWSWLPERHQGELNTSLSIGYPWETWKGLDDGLPPEPGNYENDRKHEGFGWMVRRPADYPGKECYAGNSDYCITHHRYQFHAVAGMAGALTRTHSLWLEARVCSLGEPTECGFIRSGGHIDFAELRVDTEHVPLPIDPDNVNSNGRRLHGGVEPDSQQQYAKDFTWYPEHRLVSIAMRSTTFGPVDPENLDQQRFYCSDPTRCHFPNHDMSESHLTVVNGGDLDRLDGSEHDLDGVADGRFSFRGYTDRWGELLLEGECAGQPLGVDCVPVFIVNLPTAQAQYRDDEHGINDGIANYDTAPEGEFWIQFPN